MMQRASGTFEVQLTPQSDDPAQFAVGRLTIEKSFRGDLEGSSAGQMLSITTAVEGSAGYVAMERVTGQLDGRSGSFALQHSGTMNRGAPTLLVTVVPDSATDELTGLSGTMEIDIVDGVHCYTFDYELPKEQQGQ